MDFEALRAALENFAKELTAKFSLPGAASPEDQLKPLVANLLAEAGVEFGLAVASRTETALTEHGVRPDVALYVAKLICGYIELKAPGVGADAPTFKEKRNKAQWKRLKALPNLIYTDGREWALYRDGERVGDLIRLSGDPSTAGAAAIGKDDPEALGSLLLNFLHWIPIVPHKPSELARYLAPLTRFLRSEVEVALKTPGSDTGALASEWRSFFFPTSDDAKFADAYAQTVTYALLLARLSGAGSLEPSEAAKTLDSGNRLLARTIELLGQPAAREELRVGFELLQRSLEALNPSQFLKSKPDLWLYFYEDFLAAYDPKLRKDYGVYYTPKEVVELQVRLISEQLESRFGKKLGFADDGVVFLDPAVGTGTYLVAAVKHALEKVRLRSGEGAVAGRATQMAENMYGFEVLVGPYAVSHLRLSQAIEGVGGEIHERLGVYLADTLESPNRTPTGGLSLTHKALTQEHEAARKIKNDGEILVCLGNPPYDREQRSEADITRQRKGGWVRFGDKERGGAEGEKQGDTPIFEDFLEPARKAGKGLNLQVIFNDYVYFWRWALWRLFEQQSAGGIVSFITASSYLSGPGFVGVREVMRKTFDHLWIIDLGGDNLGARKTPNVFNIQTPVAIAIGVRGPSADASVPAVVRYAKVEGSSRADKLATLAKLEKSSDLKWKECGTDWQAPFRPEGEGRFFEWPNLDQLFPLHTAGAVFYRSWPIAETEGVLSARWSRLVSAPAAERLTLLKKSRDRDTSYRVNKSQLPGYGEPTVAEATAETAAPGVIDYGFRAYDRQKAFYDFRLGDFLRPVLASLAGDRQIFLIAPDTLVVGTGQAMIATPLIPDQHHFRGSFGGRDVFPLYRNSAGTEANVTAGLLAKLGTEYGMVPTAEQFAAYVYAVLAGQSYTNRFWSELETPGLRIPITKDGKVFETAVALGERLLWLHTYAKTYRVDDEADPRGDEIPAGVAKAIVGVPTAVGAYPEKFSYDPETWTLTVGAGKFGPVSNDVWDFEVSGLKIIHSWLRYRMKKRGGKKSSKLDDIRPTSWTAKMSDELLELIWVIEASLNAEPALKASLDSIVKGACFTAAELPVPTESELKPPTIDGEAGDLLELMAADDSGDEDEDEEEDDDA